MDPRVPIIRAAGEGDKRSFLGGGVHTWKLMSEDTEGALFIFEDALTRNKTTPMHRHPEADEVIYVVDGEIVVNVAGDERRVGTGGMLFTPKGVPHAFLVCSERARLLTVQTPGIGQTFYRSASEATTEDTSETIDIARVRGSAHQNPRAVELLGPPPFEHAALE
jgi:quercetin dioxygenase-like cupin family protein